MRSALLFLLVFLFIAAPAKASFFGVMSLETLTKEDAEETRELGIEAYRFPMSWHAVQRDPWTPIDWSSADYIVRVAVEAGLEALPILSGTPSGFAVHPNRLPIDNTLQKWGWQRFVEGAVQRYGSGGSFWRENPALPYRPIKTWQVWNEPNFYYFAYPVSPRRYTELLRTSFRIIKKEDSSAKVMAAGLFGDPSGKPPHAMSSWDFLRGMYKNGASNYFDSLALHPYAPSARRMKEITSLFQNTIAKSKDRGRDLHITELGWGSDSNTAFGKGSLEAQADELREAYNYLLDRKKQLSLRSVYWFALKDVPAETETCVFCYQTGLFYQSSLNLKPSGEALYEIIHGDFALKGSLEGFVQRVLRQEVLLSEEEIILEAERLWEKESAALDRSYESKRRSLGRELSRELEKVRAAARKKLIAAKQKSDKKKVRTWKRRQVLKLKREVRRKVLETEDSWMEAGQKAQSLLDELYRHFGRERVPKDFWGTMTVENITEQDMRYLKEAFGTYRVSWDWRQVQTNPEDPFNWGAFDALLRLTTLNNVTLLPALHSTPSGWAKDWRQMPVASDEQKRGWQNFLEGAAKRYGSGGTFWRENPALPYRPIRAWQVWNEPNDHWFTTPVSPKKYGQLLDISAAALKGADPGARVIAGGLFAPSGDTAKSRSPERFLQEMNTTPDALALHPYAPSARQMIAEVNLFRQAADNLFENMPLYITEIGWQSDSATPFGKGSDEAQAKELFEGMHYLLGQRRRLNLRGVTWFAWKDAPKSLGTCQACYESGLFKESLTPKPAWSEFLRAQNSL